MPPLWRRKETDRRFTKHGTRMPGSHRVRLANMRMQIRHFKKTAGRGARHAGHCRVGNVSTPHQRLADRYSTANRTCAAIILADPLKYGGQGSLMVEWAKLVLDGEKREQTRTWRLVA